MFQRRKLHIQYDTDHLNIIDDTSSQPIYTGAMTVGVIAQLAGISSIQITRPNHSFVGKVTWSTTTGEFDIVVSSGRRVTMNAQGHLGRKISLHSSVGELKWKKPCLLHSGHKLVSGNDAQVARLSMSAFSKDMGSIQLDGQAAVEGELMDEVVLSALGILLQDKELSGVELGGGAGFQPSVNK